MIAAGIQAGAELNGSVVRAETGAGADSELTSGILRPGGGLMTPQGNSTRAGSGFQWASFLPLFGVPSQAALEKGAPPPVSSVASGRARGDAQPEAQAKTAQPAGLRRHVQGRAIAPQAEKPGRAAHGLAGSQKASEDGGGNRANAPTPGTDFVAAAQTPTNTLAVPAPIHPKAYPVHGQERIMPAATIVAAQDTDSVQQEVRSVANGTVADSPQSFHVEPKTANRASPAAAASPVATTADVPDAPAKGERPTFPTNPANGVHSADAVNHVDPAAAFRAWKGNTEALPDVVADISPGGMTEADPVTAAANREVLAKGSTALESVDERPEGSEYSRARRVAVAGDSPVQMSVHSTTVKAAHALAVDQKPNMKAVRLNPANDSMTAERPSGNPNDNPAGAAPLRDFGALSDMSLKEETLDNRSHATISASPRETFAALDAAVGPATTWIHAGMHRAEAGYLDPALGWVSVRADAAGSGLHAALTPSSAQAAQVLGNHLAGLNAYVSEHHGSSALVTMTAFESGQTGGGPGSHSEPGRDGRETAPGSTDDLTVERTAARPPGTAPSADGESSLPPDARYISVVA